MKFILMDYVQENGWTKLSKAEQQQWLGAYQAFLDAIENAGVLKSSTGLENSSDAATVRTANSKSHVLDGPYSDSKEQLGGFHIIDVPDLDTAITWAARSPTSLHGVVEVRAIRDKTMAEWLAEVSSEEQPA